jgi:hypothetical protein
MTDDERIALIDKCYAAHSHGSIQFLLRVIRDQRAELTQARQAITNMREHSDQREAELKQHFLALSASIAAVQVVLK